MYQIAGLSAETDKRTLAVWACDCAERVLPYFEEKHAEIPARVPYQQACRAEVNHW
jgi:hypothetical protein